MVEVKFAKSSAVIYIILAHSAWNRGSGGDMHYIIGDTISYMEG
jgi:hypothetical protein